jgi:hypothetical protein
MTNQLILAPVPPESRAGEPLALTPAQVRLRKMVLDAVQSPHSKRNYAKALDDLFAFCASRPLSRSLEGKGRRIRTVAIPIWFKHGINAWMTAAGIEDGRLLRSVSKSGKINRDSLSDWAVWSVVEQSSKQIGSSTSVPTTCEGLAPSCAGRTAAISSRSNSCWGTRRSRPPSAIWAPSRISRSRSTTTLDSSGDRDFSRILGTPQF